MAKRGGMSIYRKICFNGVLLLFMVAMNVQANTVSFEIQDNYIGALPTHLNWVGKDVVGNEDWFGVDRMTVSVDYTHLTVAIYTNYVNHIGQYDTQLGDLFISTNGWNPEGEAPYLEDKMGNGTDWNYVLVMDSHTPSATSGNLYLYSVINTNIILSDDITNGNQYYYRGGQEVQYGLNNNESPFSIGGIWNIDNNEKFLKFQIAHTAFGSDFNPGHFDLGFHWTQTCGNDVIEGGISQSPEPTTMLLFGVGLLGIVGVIRKRKL